MRPFKRFVAFVESRVAQNEIEINTKDKMKRIVDEHTNHVIIPADETTKQYSISSISPLILPH